MKKRLIRAVTMLAIALFASTGFAATSGKQGFEKNCAVCHKDGGNMVNPSKTLSKKDREANGVKSAKDIIAKMRKPGPGMTAFDTKTISDKEAKMIAVYIMNTFK